MRRRGGGGYGGQKLGGGMDAVEDMRRWRGGGAKAVERRALLGCWGKREEEEGREEKWKAKERRDAWSGV